MNNPSLLRALTTALSIIDTQQEWIDAVPEGTPLPAMPGYDREARDAHVEELRELVASAHIAPERAEHNAVQALREAQAGLEFAQSRLPGPVGDFVPAYLLALRHVNKTLAAHDAQTPTPMLHWSGHKRPDANGCRSDHEEAPTPLGLARIEWKSYKEHDMPVLYLGGEYADVFHSVAEAKAGAERLIKAKLQELLDFCHSVSTPTPETPADLLKGQKRTFKPGDQIAAQYTIKTDALGLAQGLTGEWNGASCRVAAKPMCSCPSVGGSLRWPCVEHQPDLAEIPEVTPEALKLISNAGPFTLHESVDGGPNFRDISSKTHLSFLRVVWNAEGNERTPAYEDMARFVVAALNLAHARIAQPGEGELYSAQAMVGHLLTELDRCQARLGKTLLDMERVSLPYGRLVEARTRMKQEAGFKENVSFDVVWRNVLAGYRAWHSITPLAQPLREDEGCPHHGTDHVCLNQPREIE